MLYIYAIKLFLTEIFFYSMNMLIKSKNMSEQMLIKIILKTVYE